VLELFLVSLLSLSESFPSSISGRLSTVMNYIDVVKEDLRFEDKDKDFGLVNWSLRILAVM